MKEKTLVTDSPRPPIAADVRRARTGFIWVGVVAPFALLAIAAAIVLAWMPELPDPIATHWGNGGVDGFMSKTAFLPTILGICGGVILLDVVLAFAGHRMPQSSTKPPVQQWGPTSRFLGAVNLGLGVLFVVLLVSTTAIQRGLADAADAPDVGGWAALGMLGLVVFAVIGWFLQPKSPVPAASVSAPVDTIPLSSSERAAWFGTVTMARVGIIVLVAALAMLVVLTVFLAAAGEASWWINAALGLVVTVLTGTMAVFRVRISTDGLRVRSLIGWPSTRIPLDRIEKVECVQINPMGEFGGWGWRIGMDGRRGVVLRAGEALQVTQTTGRVFVVTVDGAADAASVLETLRSQSA
ncbi:DUF1648 domain-containing protein [uncultured Microbacterium sp.]|uniref:DUF1648 domain-containing protein n=1 Tax=uncultured Microbacterium sp. TaxID=191216 RepID=UPI0026315ED8|nr:DUF1648 domain-containing protein [uncultured Microbacterium sp.]